MQQIFQPIDTEVGVIFGRDAIFLDSVIVGVYPNSLELIGEFNSSLCSKYKDRDEFIKYNLKFSGVLAYMMTELDLRDFLGKSSFDLVVNSEWINELNKWNSSKKLKSDHKHFMVFTYDDVFDVICQSYELTLLESRPKKS